MMNLSQLLTDQRAYEGITHSRWGASWNWRWRMIGDDEDRRPPSPEPRTDSRSALPRGFRAWRRLRIVKRDESFSLIFSPRTRIYRVGVEVGGASGGPRGRGRALGGQARPPPSWIGCGPLDVDSSSSIFYIPKIFSVKFQVIPRTFISAQK